VRNWQVLLSDWQTWPSWWHTPHASASRTSANSRLVDAICGNSVANVWSRATVRRTAANSLGTATENYTHRQLVAHDRQNQQRVDNSKSQHHNHFWGEIWSASSFSVLFCASVLEKTHTYKWCRFLTSRLVAWLSGRMSVFGRHTFSVLRSTCSWRVTTYVGKTVRYGSTNQRMAPSGERIRRKGRHGVFAGKTVWSMPERFEIYIVYKRRYINMLPFLSFSNTQRIVSKHWSKCTALTVSRQNQPLALSFLHIPQRSNAPFTLHLQWQHPVNTRTYTTIKISWLNNPPMPSVLWRDWLGVKKSIYPVNKRSK